MRWLEKLNEVFEWNSWTEDGKVTIEYAELADVVVVRVFDEVELIKMKGLTDFDIMYAIMDKVKEMYNK